ncbi:MAG: dephospho-CoA kinase [Bacteroidetes bacterium CG18_big_fil_WC_8_21_14_2_50_41_14]|nr:MAG: dephospho-CoA kinase [Bacteroidetes bacterium CG18_big_fil_WC_8_21_14_2_50_41_14]PJB54768.1 MAG: dephospho-CoA kinase [Bacteroidetes bacterium CG_4_9_14_3_um_filter_41_19]
MKRIGLTGNMGSGKSTVARIFEVLKAPVFYSDEMARQLYQRSDVKKELALLFPDNDFYMNGIFQKSELAALVFSNPESLQKINQLIHPLVEQEFQTWAIAFKDKPYVVHESAIIFENKLQKRFNSIIHVAAPEEIRKFRIMQRDQVDIQKVEARMKNQLPEEEKRLLADYIIENDGDQLLIPQVIELHQVFSAA